MTDREYCPHDITRGTCIHCYTNAILELGECHRQFSEYHETTQKMIEELNMEISRLSLRIAVNDAERKARK